MGQLQYLYIKFITINNYLQLKEWEAIYLTETIGKAILAERFSDGFAAVPHVAKLSTASKQKVASTPIKLLLALVVKTKFVTSEAMTSLGP